MPLNIDPNNNGMRGMGEKFEKLRTIAETGKFPYTYPRGLDLRPGSDLSKFICTQVLQRARASRTKISKRFDIWNAVDDMLNVYIDLDEEELRQKTKDPRRPVSMVVSASFSVLETLLTFNMSAVGDILYPYQGVGPEDTAAAIKMERVIDVQAYQYKHLLAHNTSWRDGYCKGIGAIYPIWDKRPGMVLERAPVAEANLTTGVGSTTAQTVGRWVEGTVKEGHRLQAINPKNLIYDMNVPEHEIQERGEYVGFLNRDNLTGLLNWERSSDGEVFNCKYLQFIDGRTSLSDTEDVRESDRAPDRNETQSDGSKVIDTVTMEIDLIPSMWGIGDSDYPEKWLFVIGGDTVPLYGKKIETRHGMFSMVFNVPDYNGHDPLPIGRMEVIYPLNHYMNFLFNSRALSQRKGVGGRTVYDPSVINEPDLLRGGKHFIRVRRQAWGRNAKDSIFTLDHKDQTDGNMRDAGIVMELMERLSGAVTIMQGVQRDGPERVSATEADAVRQGAISRLQRLAKLTGLMSHQDISRIIASQTQQYMSKPVMAKITGRMDYVLRGIYGDATDYMTVNPEDIDCNFDVLPMDGLSGQRDNPTGMSEILKTMLANPNIQMEISQRFDPIRMIKNIYRQMGVRNVDEMERLPGQAPPVNVQVVPDEQIGAGVESGKLLSAGQPGGFEQ